MRTTTLNNLQFGRRAMIKSFTDQAKPFRSKLLAMGVTPGCEVLMIRSAPLGDPIQISIRGFHLCLRKSEASVIYVEEII